MAKRRTKAEIEQFEKQIYEALLDDNPQSVRHVFYRMTDPRKPVPAEKSDRGYRQVQHRMTLMRKRGAIPYGWVVDTSRRAYYTNTYTDAEDFVTRHAAAYRADLWGLYSDCHVEVWCESRSLASVLMDDCRDLAVSLYPAGGFASDSFAYESAQEIAHVDRPTVVIYAGDYDPAGVLIDRDIEKKLRYHLGADFPLQFERVAINREQISRYNLPTKPRKATERRRMDIQDTVEAEAMPAGAMRAILREKIESYLEPNALRVVKITEERERDRLLSFVR